jgi:hypothetical protein
VDARVAEGELLELLSRARPPQHRADPSQQLPQGERLGDVVVGAQLEAAHAVPLLAAGGQHDHRDVDPAAPQLAADVPAAHARHHDVEQDQVGRLAGRPPQPVLAVQAHRGLVALEAQVVLEPADDVRLVVDDEDPRQGAASA